MGGAFAMGSEGAPLVSPGTGRGGGAQSMSAMDPVAFGCGRLRPQCGDRRRSTARLLWAAEMQPKTSGSDAGGSAAGGGGGVAVLGVSPVAAVAPLAGQPLDGRLLAPDRSCLQQLLGGERVGCPTSRLRWSHTHCPPLVSKEVGFGAFRGSGALKTQGRGSASPRRLGGGGGVHRREAGGAETGRAWEASQEDSAAAPARRSWGTSTWRPGVTRGAAFGQREPAAGSVCPLCPGRQQRLMPQPRLLHLRHNGAPCSKQSAP